MSRKRSPVWQYFDHTEGGKKCKICEKTVLCDGNTSNLFSHLKFNHVEEHAKLTHRDGKTSTQLKISDVLGDYNLLNGKDFWDKIDQLISWWVIKNNQPFRVVDNPEFRAILYALNKKYNPPHRKRLVNLIRDLYNIKKEQVKDFFGNIKWFCLTTDSWKDIKNQRSYIAITVHFIHDYLPGSICISASQITAISATATVLKEIIMNTLGEWNLDVDKLVAIVTDGGTNFVAAAKAISKHIHCVAHRLNLVVNDTLSSCKDIIAIISKVRAIVTSFKKSSNLMAELMAELDKEGMEQIKVKQDIETRWNSEYMMIERYLQLSVQISNVLRKNCMRNIDLNDDEVSLLSEVASLLKPVYEMTNDLSGDKYITISRVIPILFLVRNKILKTKIQHYNAKSMQNKLLVNLDTRLMNVEDSCLFAFPTLLDPRFKKIAFTSTSACSNRITELSTLISDVPTTQQPPHEVDDSDLWSLLDKRVNQISNPLSGAANGLKHFVEADCLSRDSDPLEFWKNNKNNWPQLHNIFLKYAVVQPTSVPSERVFSKTGLIITDQRNKIKPENVDMLCFLESLPNVFH